MNRFARRQLLASTLLMSVAGIATPALAQDAQTAPDSATSTQIGDDAAQLCATNPNAPDCANKGQDIVVTGSRIASPTLVSASPLQVVDARDIRDSGQVNLQSVLQVNPAVSAAPTLSRTNSNFLTSSAGVATIDLLNLGTSRTLTLINSHRTVAGIPGTNTVDYNTIPAPFVERVDVLTGGASSVYGSDAVAGVVNIIYKKDFQGIQLDAQTGITQRGDGSYYQLGGMIGHNFDDNRGNIMIYAGYSKENAVYSSGRTRSAIDQNACFQVANSAGGCSSDINNGIATGSFPLLLTAYRPFFSGFNPGGTITFGGISRTIGDGGTLNLVNTNGLVHNNDGVPSTVRACTTADPCHPTVENATGFNRSAFRTIAVPVERYLLAFRGNYAISDHINASLEGNFARSRSTTLIEPFPFQTAGVNGVAPNACLAGTAQKICGGYIPIQTRLANGTIVRNPYVPDFIFNNATDVTGDGLKDISFTRRLADFGPRTYTVNRTSYRVLAGLDGDIFTNFKWDAFFTYGETTESQYGTGQVNLNSFTSSLEVIPGPNGPQCADSVARAQGCLPSNIFGGPGSISAGAVNYIQAPQTRNTNTTQLVTGGSVSGNLLNLWDGPLGVAAGVEYRKETSAALNDPLTVAGLNGGNAIANTSGTFNVKEAYGEVKIPLLAHRPFFEDLSVDAAGRVSDYSLRAVGTVYSWNANVEYAPIRDIRFRSVLAHATRAPNIGELFAGRAQTFPTGLVDPCVGVTLTSTTPASARCRQDQGVLNNIAVNGGAFAVNQSDIQGISGFNSGNPNLKQETGNTFTVGAVINPTSIHALRNFAVTVDYFNIRVRNVIAAYGRSDILKNCYIGNDPTFCALITRRLNAEGPNSPGSLQFINAPNGNLGSLKTTGINATLSYRQSLSDLGLGSGTLTSKLSYARLLVFRAPGTDYNLSGEEGLPRDRASGDVSYADKNWSITFRGNFIGRSYLPRSFSSLFAPDGATGAVSNVSFRVPSYFTLDSQIRFTPGNNFEFFVGVTNLTDAATPLLISGIPGDTTGTETDAGTYDPIGRRFYSGVRLKF